MKSVAGLQTQKLTHNVLAAAPWTSQILEG